MSTNPLDIRTLQAIDVQKAPLPFSQVPILAAKRIESDEDGWAYDLFVIRLESGEFLFIAEISSDDNYQFDDFLPGTYSLGFSTEDSGIKMRIFEAGNEAEPVCTRDCSSLRIYSEVGPDTIWPPIKIGEPLSILVADVSSKDPFLLVWQSGTGDFRIITIPEAVMRTIRCDRGKGGIEDDPNSYAVTIVRGGGFMTLDISKRNQH